MPKHGAVFFKLTNELGLKRVLARIKVGPKLLDGLRNFLRTQRRKSGEQESNKQNSRECHRVLSLSPVITRLCLGIVNMNATTHEAVMRESEP